MPLETPFTCVNGHNFVANAKLRARCPECGALTRKSFQSKAVEPVATAPQAVPAPEPPKPSIKKPVMLRQGREMPKKAAPKPAATKPAPKKPLIGAKVSGGLVKSTRVKRGITPTIRRAPKRTAPARHVVGESSKGVSGYLQDMMRRAGF